MIKNILVTGYRAHELGIYNQKHPGIPYIRQAIANRLIPLAEEGLEWVITPGQYGVDLWACEAVIDLKAQYPDLQLAVITAYSNQEETWKEERQAYYAGVLKHVDYYEAVSHQPYAGTWQFRARDELLLRKTDGILLVYDEEAGAGSPRFIKEQARRKSERDGYVCLSISSEDIQSLVSEAAYDSMEPVSE